MHKDKQYREIKQMTQYKISSIPECGCKGLSIKRGDREVKVFVVRHGDTIVCYHNICPHTGANLDWIPEQFLNASRNLIQCSTHGAQFRIGDGYCISGSCVGQKLFPLKVKIEGEMFEVLFE